MWDGSETEKRGRGFNKLLIKKIRVEIFLGPGQEFSLHFQILL